MQRAVTRARRGRRSGGRGTYSEGDFGIGDIFSDLFGARGARAPGAGFSLRGQDLRYTLEVDFVEAVAGARKRVTLPEGGTLDLTVPEGVVRRPGASPQGQGAPGLRGGEHGDALVEIRVRSHPHFRRQGDDILLEVPITIDEAVLGAKIEVPTVSGRVALQVPKATSSGRVFRLKGKGVRNLALRHPRRPARYGAHRPARDTSTIRCPISFRNGARSMATIRAGTSL